MNSTVKVLLLIVCVLMYASIVRCASVSKNSIDENQTDIHSIPSNYQLAECKCTGGKCVFENGEESFASAHLNMVFSIKDLVKLVNAEKVPIALSHAVCVAGPCSTKPCQNGGTCTVDGQSFKCDCKPPFTGNTCEIGPCSSNPCQNEGTCAVEGQSFKCECKSPFSGKNCETECDCKNGKCRVTENNEVICECLPEYGKYDDVCTACDCGTGANCTFDVGFFSTEKYCLCPDGRKLKNQRCEDPCNNSPCKNGGTCKVEGKKFKCACKPPYLGDLCERDLCSENPCKNSGTCKISGTTFQCNCKQPYSGELCEKDPCTDNPCKNGGTCKREKIPSNALVGAPFYGDTCEKDPCTDNPCKNEGICMTEKNSFKCICRKPFYGETCEKDPCTIKPCKNGGTCTLDKDSFRYPCTIKPCKNGGTCALDKDSFRCNCRVPYFGDTCEKDPCSANPCKNGGTCNVDKNSFKCSCKTPYFGNNCDKDPCTVSPCRNGGTCKLFENSFKCDCKVPYTGNTCEKDPCSNNPCKNGGTCRRDKDSFMCDCQNPFYGKTCEEDGVNSSTSMSSHPATVISSTKPTTKKPASCTKYGDCLNEGICKRTEDQENFCECLPHFGGTICEMFLPCVSLDQSCRAKGAVCKVAGMEAICECPPDKAFHQKSGMCEDICDSRKCAHGKCEIDGRNYKCNCDEGYIGTHCDKMVKKEHENFVPWFTVIASINLVMCLLLIGVLCLVCQIQRFIKTQ
ncbi:adhesive plaque matrix protein 2 [Caerostris extrusa]|uniref:Adhesive plaque matrix protein 2 n=1 Tax=Caerostris extrusa TaxID=172846 RepID=A0AAV4VB68_CAEEX|nr:adhesive plaque matrix protein 2 [Caerostris extrusa]